MKKNIHITINLRHIQKKYISGWKLTDNYNCFGWHKKQVITFEKSVTRS